MHSTEENIFNLSYRELADLNEFKRKHIPCGHKREAFDLIPDDCFSYHYYPSTVGGLIRIECVCGAEWFSMDGDFGTREVPEPKVVKDEELLVQIVDWLLMVTERPALFLQSKSLTRFYTHMNGIWQALSFVKRHEEYGRLTKRVNERLIKSMPEYNPRNPLCENLLKKTGDETTAFAYWRNTLLECLKEEYPEIFNSLCKE